MQIRKSTIGDFDDIMKLYDAGRKFMRQNGNENQWLDGYPPEDMIKNDIKAQKSYICEDEGKAVAVFYFDVERDKTYEKIYDGAWLNDEPYGVVHRIASVKKGAGTFCLDYCFKKINNIRIDTHKDNIPMQRMLKKNGYVYCGIIYIEDGSERIAFQKIK